MTEKNPVYPVILSEKIPPNEIQKKTARRGGAWRRAAAVRGEGERVHRLNKTSAAIWKLCDGERGLSDIAASLAREFRGASLKEIEADVSEALLEMGRLGILSSRG